MKIERCRWLGTLLLCVGLAAASHGQTPDAAPTPHDPLLARAPDGSWTVTYQYKATPAESKADGPKSTPPPPSERIHTVRTDKKGASYHVVATEVSGKKAEHWSINGVQIYRHADSKTFVKLAKGSPYYIDFGSSDFDELSWLGKDDYKGLEAKDDGSKFFIYEVKNKDRRQTAEESASTGDLDVMVDRLGMLKDGVNKKEAIDRLMTQVYGSTVSHATLDAYTQLPATYDDGKVARTYTYTAEPLAVPKELTKFFTNMAEQKRKATVPVPRP